jgi:hypothetical protein
MHAPAIGLHVAQASTRCDVENTQRAIAVSASKLTDGGDRRFDHHRERASNLCRESVRGGSAVKLRLERPSATTRRLLQQRRGDAHGLRRRREPRTREHGVPRI